MKKKIGELYNRPVVIGDRNLVTKNETHISELQENNEGEGENSNIELTKGKKILSEYYYFNLGLIKNNSKYNVFFGPVFSSFGFSLGTFNEPSEKLPIVESIENNYPVYKAATELNNIIVKYKVDDAYRYTYDSLPSLNDINDLTNVYIAIRKYCFIYNIEGSGIALYKYNLTNFIDCFDAYIYAMINAYGPSEEGMNQHKQTLNDMIKDCSITEEEFWAEANIINNIDEIS